MAADNHTTIIGNLVEDPEVRFTNTGIAVTNLRVAVTQRVQQEGQWRDGDTSFFKVNVWRDQAEHLAESLGKGDRVMVTGRLRQRSWETPEGDKRSVTELEHQRRLVAPCLSWTFGLLGYPLVRLVDELLLDLVARIWHALRPALGLRQV
jgi:single-strand DNA-binding protein